LISAGSIPLVKDLLVPASAPRFASIFQALTGNLPYPWQEALFLSLLADFFPGNINLPTGSGKTSIMAVWLAALAQQASDSRRDTSIPRRLVWVVDRRVVVDQATDEAEQIRTRLRDESNSTIQWLRTALSFLSNDHHSALGISTLRGEREDNQEWSREPSRPAIIVGSVDMIGSRLLFSGYGDGLYSSSQHAGLLGHDALIVNDEAHLTPAFAALLRELEAMQPQPLKPFRTMRLSATHTGPECWPESLNRDRLDARFRKSFEASKGLNIQVVPASKIEAAILESATEQSRARTLIFVREPEKAKRFAGNLAKKTGQTDRILTLTGTMRGFERDRMVKTEAFRAFARPELPSESWWLVATSAGEVGINISADRLITDLDTLDHLLQRFGRLNRFGETEGIAYLLLSEAEEKTDGKDDRKRRNRAALEFLRELPKRQDGLYDISPGTLFGRDLHQIALSDIPLKAPLHNWHIDVWSQTSLATHPARPAVDSWLHGKQDDIPETYVAWRGDVQYLLSEDIDPDDRKEVLQKYRLLAHELLREPTTQLIAKLETLAQDSRTNAKFLIVKRDGGIEIGSIREFGSIKSDAERRLAAARVAFCKILFPPGCGTLVKGMFSPEWTQCDDEGLSSPDAHAGKDPYDVSGCLVARELGEIDDTHRASFKGTQLDSGEWSLERFGGIPRLQYVPLTLKDLALPTLRGFASHHQWRFLLKVPLNPPEGASDDRSVALLYFGKARDKKLSTEVYPLHDHLCEVAQYAKALAIGIGLPQQIASALELAGKFHDLGKGEMIWQKAAGNLSNDGSLSAGTAVAKSIKPMRGRDLNGFRHELASLRHIEPHFDEQHVPPELRELVLHLVAAHHGHSRPCFSGRAYDRNQLAKSEALALAAAQRFASLQSQYGAWGLAYLEAILKSADGLASGNREDPTYA
jgi:CRISPR-associated endonuclease/helicase Cas3